MVWQDLVHQLGTFTVMRLIFSLKILPACLGSYHLVKKVFEMALFILPGVLTGMIINIIQMSISELERCKVYLTLLKSTSFIVVI